MKISSLQSAWRSNIWLRRSAYAFALLGAFLVFCAVLVPRPLFCDPVSTVALSRDGQLISARIAADGQWRFAEADSTPPRFEVCLTAFEDSRFRYHFGIDPMAIARALRNDVRRGRAAEGGSTLTMQLARMARGGKSRTLGQKAIEALWAIGIEMTHSKDEILALYASHAPMGGNVVGLEAAAWRYFGRRAAELSWAESALLAVLPNAPARVHVARNRDTLKSKRDRLLSRLLSNGQIDSSTFQLAVAEPLPEKPFPIENCAPQLLDRLERTANEAQATSTTSIDASLQKRVQSIADDFSGRYAAGRINDIGVLVAEVRSGCVLAYIGNSSRESPTWMVDMISAERSSGSTLKPFLFATMLTSGEMTPKCLWADTPLDINGFMPQNYSRSFSGAVSAGEALTRSLNVPLVRMLSAHNTGRFLADLKQMGFTSLRFSAEHYGASLILGGAEVSLWDLCGAYSSMARHLTSYNEAPERAMSRPLDDFFSLRLSPSHSVSRPERLLSASLPTPAAIWHTFEAMSNLSRPEEEADWQMFSSMKRVAWKTGTSFGGRDAWAVGLTRDYVVGVWVGNATGEGRAGMTGVGFAAPVMFDVFSLLPASSWFDEPLDDEDPMPICKHSGMRASDVCPDVDTVRLPRQCAKTDVCRYCRLAHLTPDGQWQVNSSCESVAQIVSVARFVLPPAMEFYYCSRHADYVPLPPMRPDCDDSPSGRVAIIYPQAGQSLVRTRDFDGRLQGVVCQAAAPSSATLFWHLDDSYLGSTSGNNQMLVEPESGPHRLTVVAADGQSASVSFSVE